MKENNNPTILESVFSTLAAVDVSKMTEQKKDLTYLSWVYAWAEVAKRYPDVTYEVEKFGPEKNIPYAFDPLTGYMVYTKVTIMNKTLEMWLPVMDAANYAMKDKPYKVSIGAGSNARIRIVNAADMFDVNKTIMRCLVKNLGMFGLGINIYASEDLPLITADEIIKETPQSADYAPVAPAAPAAAAPAAPVAPKKAPAKPAGEQKAPEAPATQPAVKKPAEAPAATPAATPVQATPDKIQDAAAPLTIQVLIARIGDMRGDLKAKNGGNTAVYDELVVKATGQAGYKVKGRTESDRPQVEAIYNALQSAGYTFGLPTGK